MTAQPVVISIPPAIQVERILYATDFSWASERALPIVSAIARHYGSQVHIAHIWNSKPYPIPDVGMPITSEEETQARGKIADLLTRPELQNLRTILELEEGDPIERMVNYVQTHAINLVVLGTHGRTRVAHALMGSVAEELFRTLKCPVLTIGPNLDARFTIAKTISKILFPTDLSPESKAVFPHLASIAAEFGSKIVILHVLPKETETNPNARKLAEPLRHRMEKMFAHQLSCKTNAEFVLEFGDDVASRILSAAEYYESDLIGMGIREGNELIAHFRSTAAYKVAVGTVCPVLTVRGTL